MNPLKTDGRGRFRFHFSIWHQDIPARFGVARILVSPVTGLVEAYMAPDIDPERLEKINPVPAVTPEEAKAAFYPISICGWSGGAILRRPAMKDISLCTGLSILRTLMRKSEKEKVLLARDHL